MLGAFSLYTEGGCIVTILGTFSPCNEELCLAHFPHKMKNCAWRVFAMLAAVGIPFSLVKNGVALSKCRLGEALFVVDRSLFSVSRLFDVISVISS